jgi:thiamine-phosphate pyrophosphorylase
VTRLTRPPIVCLVTDRRRLPAPADDTLVTLARHAAWAGVSVIQVREPDLDDRRLARLVSRVVEAVGGTATAVMVNERADVAIASGAHGVHLRGDAPPTLRVRACVPDGFLIGRSVHGREEAADVQEGADFLIMGTIFPTASKPALLAPAGPEGLAGVCRAVERPVLAIGGVAAGNLAAVAGAGAAGIAAIDLFTRAFLNGAGDPGARLADVVATIRRAFASAGDGPRARARS